MHRRGTSRRAWLGAAALACVAGALVPALAAAAPRDLEARISLQGSNGFEVKLAGGAFSGFRTASFSARRGRRQTGYGLNRDVTLKRRLFAADLGELGSFRVHFEPRSARTVDGDPRCGKGRARVVSGIFRGRIRLAGEHGFTAVDATRAPGKLIHSGLGYCRMPRPGPGPHDPERRISLSGCAFGDRSLSGLIVISDRPRSPRSVLYSGLQFERLAGLFVSRRAIVRGPSATLASAPGFGSAELTPPGPFRGSAAYEADPGGGELSGDLAVGFAGSGGPVALTPTDEAAFGPGRRGLLDCAYGLVPVGAGPGPVGLARPSRLG